jgi:Flp pilus assembly protein TadG
MIIKAREKGQALILIALAAIGLFAFAALAIDGTRAYSNKRHAQNAADTAALAGALAFARGNDIESAAIARAQTNGYVTNGTSTEVTVTMVDVPIEDCPSDTTGKDITVTIVSHLDTTFSKIIGTNQIESGATATSRACGFYYKPLFNGYPIVGLNPDKNAPVKGCGFTTGTSGSVEWEVEGGGIFSNGCAYSKNPNSVDFHGACAASVGGANGFDCQTSGRTDLAIAYPAGVDAITPPNPCGPGGIGISQAAHGSSPNFSNGVFCISDLDALDKKDITLDNATLYVTDTAFNLKFAGGGGFYGTPTQHGGYTGSDPYDNYYMIVVRNNAPCPDFAHGQQVIEWRGNGAGTFTGTVLAPSACLDVRGNGSPSGMHTQLIAYVVGSNGDADVYINYQEDENHCDPISPSITVLR